MTSDDELRGEVVRLRREGVSVRAVAELLGVSKSRVGRIAVEAAEDDDDLDGELDGEDGLALLDATDSYAAVPPFRFVGLEPVIVQHPGCDPEPAEQERFLDANANGRSCSMLDIYRADFADGSEGHGLCEDAGRQIEAAGYHAVSSGGRWRWERV